MSFDDLVAMRKAMVGDVGLDGVDELLWVQKDNGAFTGPLTDWVFSHQHAIDTHCREFDTVITAGGNCGMYARMYSSKFKFVYTFEPDPVNFHCLVNNCQLANIIKFNCALGAGPALISLNRQHCEENVGMFTVNQTNDEERIPVITLDSMKFKNVGLIHLDVEGFESAVIAGATNTIREHRPVIMLENGEVCEEALTPLNYQFVGKSMADAIFIPLEWGL